MPLDLENVKRIKREWAERNKDKINEKARARSKEKIKNENEQERKIRLEKARKHRAKQRDKRNAYRKKYYEENKEEVKARQKKYYENNKEYCNGYRNRCLEKDAEKRKSQERQWASNVDKEKKAEYMRIWRAKNAEHVRRYYRERFENNIMYRIRSLLANRLGHALRKRKAQKIDTTLDLLGCSISFLIEHLEKQFTDGMTWDNHGKWHIDHIRPCASFDLLDEDQQRICFHFSNLQPLWASDNFSKSDRDYEEWLLEKRNRKQTGNKNDS